MVGLGKIGFTHKGLGNRFMPDEFLAIVEGDGLYELGDGAQQSDGSLFDLRCPFTLQGSGQAQF